MDKTRSEQMVRPIPETGIIDGVIDEVMTRTDKGTEIQAMAIINLLAPFASSSTRESLAYRLEGLYSKNGDEA